MDSVGFDGEGEYWSSTSYGNNYKPPRRLRDACGELDHVSVPRKLRSAIKKQRRETVTPLRGIGLILDIKRRPNMFQNSLAGIITAGQKQNQGGKSVVQPFINQGTQQNHRLRVIISCPEKGDTAGKLVLLPGSLQELQDLCLQKYGFRPAKILTKNRYLVEDLTLIRDGDHLVVVGDGNSSTTTSTE